MYRRLARFRGRIRVARGRCPACASESDAPCGVCLGYTGPFPVENETLARWWWRFQGGAAVRTERSVLPASGLPRRATAGG
jgi:hypothetical protein